MSEDDRVDARRVDRQRRPVAKTEFLHALKQAAVDEKPTSIYLEQVLRTSDGAGGTEKCEGNAWAGQGQQDKGCGRFPAARTFADNLAIQGTVDSPRIAYMIRLETMRCTASSPLRSSTLVRDERPVEPKRLKSYRVRIKSLSLRSVHDPTR